jgi:hypothetical protein
VGARRGDGLGELIRDRVGHLAAFALTCVHSVFTEQCAACRGLTFLPHSCGLIPKYPSERRAAVNLDFTDGVP